MSSEFKMGDDIRQIIQACKKPEKAQAVIEWLTERCRTDGIPFEDYRWKSLVNHVCAMIDRSLTGEILDIDPELFRDVSADSIMLSKNIVDVVGGIADEEKYLLSIHFEGIKESI
ncbi:hypothetical protein [Lacrimispora sphenoides]|uniref:PRD domain protein EF_0829/AHA_3910 n=1 Tax=Lacrimispora sphenoides JCM 1415 TaxID=1297793 RepID=A0ABY1CDP8_9FIRM|nr:hypothetical protein [Lacrimispora sphenoides]SET94833.1 PRD domain protein EF_0829/AHA_3910 [[Clostridium] sphenoides JCM 1415]SUY52628.1 PRD domain protein, EF_0829/AHA_3910 family [Lacrimispora sphenoides]